MMSIFATICAKKVKIPKKKEYIYIYISLEACNYRELPSWKFCEKNPLRKPSINASKISRKIDYQRVSKVCILANKI